MVRDVGSLNGTYVNRDRIEETELASGDEVQVGEVQTRIPLRHVRDDIDNRTKCANRSGTNLSVHQRSTRASSSVTFPDVTISKIRFLEARGFLIHPERTPFGLSKILQRRYRSACVLDTCASSVSTISH